MKQHTRKTAVRILFHSVAKRLQQLALLLVLGGLVSCAHAQPTEEWAFAFTAIEWARQVQAQRYAPGLWSKAEESYKKAQSLFDERDYKGAEREFIKARNYAERAENITRLKRFQNSEVL